MYFKKLKNSSLLFSDPLCATGVGNDFVAKGDLNKIAHFTISPLQIGELLGHDYDHVNRTRTNDPAVFIGP